MNEIQAKILEIFRDFKVGKNETLAFQSVRIEIEKWDRGDQDASNEALEFLLTANYIGVNEYPPTYILLEKGYKHLYSPKGNSKENEKITPDELEVLDDYISSLQDQIDSVGRSNQISLELIEELKKELDELKGEFETANRKSSKRQFLGSLLEIGKVLAKAGVNGDEISKIITTGIEGPEKIFSPTLISQSFRLIIDLL